ncbi:ABC exporter membrane fusion protein [Gloeothece verrucosa]|uniref:ABC exporter membrane fusion protein, DevB family n=1 Tax=Gloeothece verrucosa (strain PCC 7822) TaxID=497965 RepID=E0UL88_GLOV7|nr:ABC exporter membrane fusion protein [Gloeothece verrucosa]ADN17718.1 ABC exporter membrane fusion protein, DevB family [Gloeothece verrucosa PCC 7822]
MENKLITNQKTGKKSKLLSLTGNKKILGLIIAALLLSGFSLYYFLRFRSLSPASSSIAASNTSKTKAVSALGYIKPEKEVIYLSGPTFLNTIGGNRIEKLLVKEGDYVKSGQLIAILDNVSTLTAELSYAEEQITIAQARLEQVKAGAKKGEIEAQQARFEGKKAELEGQIKTQRETIATLQAQLLGEENSQNAQIGSIQAELENAQAECKRYQLLYDNSVVSASDQEAICLKEKTNQKKLEEAQASLFRIQLSRKAQIEEAKANLNRTISTLEKQIQENESVLQQIAEVRPTDVKLAEAEVKSAIANAKKAKETVELAYVRAPHSGQILKIYTHDGERISNQGIVSIGQTAQMAVTAEVYELDISRVRLGQTAKITSSAFSGELFGKVIQVGLEIGEQGVISPDPTVDVDRRVVDVKIRLNPEDSKKVSELTNLQVNVVINTL